MKTTQLVSEENKPVGFQGILETNSSMR